MNVTNENAVLVAAIFTALSDPRFTMRGVNAVKKLCPEGTTVAQVLDTAAQMGLQQRRRISDDKLLLQRPGTVAEAEALAQRAQGVLAGNEEAFEIDFTPVQPEHDVLGDVEAGLGRAPSAMEEDEPQG